MSSSSSLPRARATRTGSFSERSPSIVARTLLAIRWRIGKLLAWNRFDNRHGSELPTLHDRLPADLRKAPSGPESEALPLRSV